MSKRPSEVESQDSLFNDATVIHKPVLVNEVLYWLNPQPNKQYLDVTFGSGGHTRAILEKESQCSVIALDWDTRSLDQFGQPLCEEFHGRLTLLWGNFALLYKQLKKEGIKAVDGLLADFGPSQTQLMQRPGFSFNYDTPLDMRMSPSFGRITAAELLAKAPEEKLRQIFWQLGEEGYAKQIAHAIVSTRMQYPIKTTRQLAQLIERIVPREPRKKVHQATKVFQALRIYINRELENIESLLAISLQIVRPGGRLVFISFHSLEDRLVKRFFHMHAQQGRLKILTPKAIVATAQEVRENPSARSAKLRAALVV